MLGPQSTRVRRPNQDRTGTADAPPSAVFKTVALVRWPDGSELAVEGICTGTITTEQRGDAGFGYDSIFVPDEADGRTFSEMRANEKHAISHRGRAFRALLDALAAR